MSWDELEKRRTADIVSRRLGVSAKETVFVRDGYELTRHLLQCARQGRSRAAAIYPADEQETINQAVGDSLNGTRPLLLNQFIRPLRCRYLQLPGRYGGMVAELEYLSPEPERARRMAAMEAALSRAAADIRGAAGLLGRHGPDRSLSGAGAHPAGAAAVPLSAGLYPSTPQKRNDAMKYTDEECERINHNYQIAVRNMNDRAWSAMLDSEKIASLQDVENKLAMDVGRIPSEVVTEVVTKELGSTTYGAQDGNTLLIDAQSLQKDDFREVLDTLYHEDAHARDWVNSVFSDRQAALSPEERQVLAARMTEVPSPEKDFNGYWNHPAEVNARAAGKAGVEQLLSDQQALAQYDASHKATNQILQTYDTVDLSGPGAAQEKGSAAPAETAAEAVGHGAEAAQGQDHSEEHMR